jgi:DNA-binding winged helix-turn-helix (wHTH) protein/tetratricopeptide (TPR) repeat protein
VLGAVGVILAFTNHEFDVDKLELRRDGELVHVEPQVLAVLEHLIEHRDRQVTKMELLDEVWGDRFVSESALTSRIKSARAACQDSGREQGVIRTIHGRGYRFVALVAESGLGAADSSIPGRVGDSSGSPGLAGREAELARLESSLAAAASGQRQAVFVTGEVGAGKSALLSEFLDRSEDTGRWQVLRGQSLQSRAGTEPYFCLLDALARMAKLDGDRVGDVLYRVAPSWMTQIPSLIDKERAETLQQRVLGATEQRMVREGVEAIETLAATRPLVLALEDLHWADAPSLDVLDLLLQRSEPVQLLVVATARTEPAEVHDLIARMAAAGRAIDLRLAPLSDDAIEAIVSDWFDGAAVPPPIVEIVRRRCEGIPLFVREMVNAWVRNGFLGAEGGVVTVLAELRQVDETIPETVRQLIERELETLDQAEIEVLEVAAVSGNELDGATAAVVSGEALEDVERRLAMMSRQVHYLDAVGGSEWPDGRVSTRFRFTHELYRQVVLDRMSVSRRAHLHGSVGRAVEEAYRGRLGEVVVELAQHFVLAGDTARAVEYLRQAGEQASTRSAQGHAAEFLLQALGRVDRLGVGADRDRAELRVRMSLGPTLVATRGWYGEEVFENYERAMSLASALGAEAEAVLARYGMATVTELRGDYALTEDLLMPLIADQEDALTVETRELLACSTFHEGSFQTSLDNSESVLATSGAETDSVLMSRMAEHPGAACNSWASLACWFLGRSDDSLRLADRAIQVGQENLYALSTARVQRAFLHQFRNEPDACGSWADSARSLAEEQGFPMRTGQATILRGWVEAVRGDARAGSARMAEGLESFRSLGARLSEPYFLGLHAEGLLLADDPDGANDLLIEALSLTNETDRSFFYAPELLRLQARVIMALGASDAANAACVALDRAIARAEGLNSPPLALRATMDRLILETEIGDPEPWEARLGSWLARYEGQTDTVDVLEARRLLSG